MPLAFAIYTKKREILPENTLFPCYGTRKARLLSTTSRQISPTCSIQVSTRSAKNASLDLYTEEDSEKLNDIIEMISPLMIHGVYRCGFAKKQSCI
jgi:glutathionyl-hydroquinone reductase